MRCPNWQRRSWGSRDGCGDELLNISNQLGCLCFADNRHGRIAAAEAVVVGSVDVTVA